ncbi:MAG TPA: hypothetical protein VGD80_13655 [Kofleriaceae bacterium]
MSENSHPQQIIERVKDHPSFGSEIAAIEALILRCPQSRAELPLSADVLGIHAHCREAVDLVGDLGASRSARRILGTDRDAASQAATSS